MLAVVVRIQMKPECREDVIEAILEDARDSVLNEESCLLFNVVQDSQDANVLYLYEVYASPEAFELHKKTPHFLKWRDAIEGRLVEPPNIATGTHLFPEDRAWKKQGI